MEAGRDRSQSPAGSGVGPWYVSLVNWNRSACSLCSMYAVLLFESSYVVVVKPSLHVHVLWLCIRLYSLLSMHG